MPMSMHDRIRQWILGIVHENTTQGGIGSSGFRVRMRELAPPFRGLLRTILQTGLFRMSCMNAGEMDTPAERPPEACMPLIPADEDDRKIHPAEGWS